MTGKQRRGILLHAVSLVFIFLFVYTSSAKLLSPAAFRVVLSQSPAVSSNPAFWALAIPVAEMMVALLLFLPRTRTAGLGASLFLMLSFTGYIVYMLLAAPHLPCSCGGIISALSWKQHLLLNSLLVLLAAYGCSLCWQHTSGNRYDQPGPRTLLD